MIVLSRSWMLSKDYVEILRAHKCNLSLFLPPNGDVLLKCILKGPYTPTIVTTTVVSATEDSPAVPEQTTVETVMNMTPENIAHFESEKEAIHFDLEWIGDDIYSNC
ncbi:hypothetical protein Tco_0445695 [Tanacetum coccineum]